MQTNSSFFSNISFRYKEGLLLLKDNNKYGFINRQGRIVIPFLYEKASSFCEGLAAVCFNKKFGYIDKENSIVIPFIYDNAKDFNNGQALVSINNEWIYIDTKGKLCLIPDLSFRYKNNIAKSQPLIKDDIQSVGCINIEGNLALSCIYDYPFSYNENTLCQHCYNGKSVSWRRLILFRKFKNNCPCSRSAKNESKKCKYQIPPGYMSTPWYKKNTKKKWGKSFVLTYMWVIISFILVMLVCFLSCIILANYF
ncbi:WG repeat-containing protein [Dysgonomonas sp. 216]|uniref:WG repeat-containing protein n=1 Tax=Dysgonomonas sp. 216 TaxID=2302934 RepID=UPI0013D2820C|nr:WG repeat-containing protein [Dysgonomonas sp. 216]NDW17633.1 WG repeat-containing protein [Dysgonomonas sp. 216]